MIFCSTSLPKQTQVTFQTISNHTLEDRMDKQQPKEDSALEPLLPVTRKHHSNSLDATRHYGDKELLHQEKRSQPVREQYINQLGYTPLIFRVSVAIQYKQ